MERVAKQPDKARDPLALKNVSISPWSFSPALGQEVQIGYELPEEVTVTLTIYGPNQEEVVTLLDGEVRGAGRHSEIWSGRDQSGHIVPDEAYFFTITAENASRYGLYDPLQDSGGERINPRDIHFDARDGIITYVLPKPSRVLVRAGLDNGPMLATLVNWQPRGPGLSTESWKGRDQQALRSFIRNPDTLVIIQPYALPENTILAVGNRQESYREAYLARGIDRPRKPSVERETWLDSIASLHWGQPVHLDKDPEIAVYIPQLEQGPPAPAELSQAVELAGGQPVFRIVVPDEHSRRFLREQRFELVVFLDDVRIAEAEQASLPFNWAWDLSQVEPGEHWLTFNLVTFRQHVGVYTRRVKVVDASPEAE